MKKYALLQSAFDVDHFRSSGHALIDQLSDMLSDSQIGIGKTTIPQKPDSLLSEWASQSKLTSTEFFQKIIDQSIKVHHPHYVGHQVSAPAHIAGLADLLSAVLNNGMGIYEMGEGATAIEKKVIDIFCDQLGFDDGDGVLTSGGTLANLTALLAARAHYNGAHVWTEGTHEPYCIFVSEMAHYCVDRAVRIMGWGSEGIVKVPVDKNYKMDVSLLPQLLDETRARGKKVIAIVGSAPCTATGSYDDLNTIAKFCSKENIWFHVDGAHGGPAIFSEKYKYLMQGSENADSVVIDAHKMMLTPALATALLFKNGRSSYKTFSQNAYYLWEAQEEQEWFNLARRTFECTKLMMSVRIYSIINLYGIEIFDELIHRQYDLARDFAALINQSPDFELAITPESNIVCFKYIEHENKYDQSHISSLNRKIRKSAFEEGTFYFVQTELKEGLFLRVSLMNPLTTLDHLKEMMNHIRDIAKNLNQQ